MFLDQSTTRSMRPNNNRVCHGKQRSSFRPLRCGVCAIIPLTRQFTVEYTALFDGILPALERLQLPVPLGGTSNHFPRAVLDAVGGWDPYNVTEDADLGIRLARAGWRVGVLSSTTWEEAPPTFRVWRGQRTRWLKGWMQTHARRQCYVFTFKIKAITRGGPKNCPKATELLAHTLAQTDGSEAAIPPTANFALRARY